MLALLFLGTQRDHIDKKLISTNSVHKQIHTISIMRLFCVYL